MDQYGHIQPRPAQCIGYGALVTKIRQRDQYAINLTGMCLKEIGQFTGFFQTLNRSIGGLVRRDGDRMDALFF